MLSKHIKVIHMYYIPREAFNHTPLEGQKLSRIYIFAECLPLVAAACQDEHREWLSCKPSLRHLLLRYP